MSNPAFIVDGYTEKNIVQKLCPGQPIRRTDLNGKGVAISAMAKRIASLIRLLAAKHYPIVVLVDKEQRSISFVEMAEQLLLALQNEGIHGIDIRIGIADRMVENWILADWETLSGDQKNEPTNPDIGNGSSIIKKVKGSYDKITDGVEYFLNARPDIMYEKSISYRYFIDKLDGIPCNYLNFARPRSVE